MINDHRSFGDTFNELKVELKEFAQTRLDMLKAEMREKFSAWKTAIPLVAIAAVLALTGWFVLTACLVTLVARAFLPSPWAYFFATLIVGVAYMLLGGAAGFLAYGEIKKNNVTPDRTLRVLKQDQVWLQDETRRAA